MKKIRIVILITVLLVMVLGLCGCGLFDAINKSKTKTYTFDVTASAGGKIELTAGNKKYTIDSGKTERYKFDENTKLSLLTKADADYGLDYWKIVVGDEEFRYEYNPYKFTLEKNTQITAFFKYLNKTVTVVDEQGNTIKTFLHHGGGLFQKLQTEVVASGYYYTFERNGVPITQQSNVVVNADLTVVATKHLQNYSISYTLYGGTVISNNPTDYNIESDPITLVNPTKPEYTFAGWVGTDLDEATDSVTINTGSTEDRRYFATWTPIDYPINYNLNGGALSEANPTTYNIETAAITLNNPTKLGYTFAGWTGTDLNSNTQTVTVPVGSTGERTYTATWTPVNYSLTFQLNGGTLDVDNPATYNIETATITLNNPTKHGYTFTGWTGTDLNSTTQTVTVLLGSTGDRQYVANWELTEYALTFKQDGVVVDTEIYTVEKSKPQIVDEDGYYIEWTVGQTPWEDYDIIDAGELNVEVTVNKQVAYKVSIVDWDDSEFGKDLKKYHYDEETKTTTFVYVDGDAPITFQAPYTTQQRDDLYFFYWSNGENDHQSSVTTVDTSLHQDQTFTAIWYKSIYVTYENYTGSTLPANILVTSDNKVYNQRYIGNYSIVYVGTVGEFIQSFTQNVSNFNATNRDDGSKVLSQMILDNSTVYYCLTNLLKIDCGKMLNLTLKFKP